MDSTTVFLFLIIIPVLTVVTSLYVYLLYKESNRKRFIVNMLSDSSAYILEKDKKNTLDVNAAASFIKLKLSHAGFLHPQAEIMFYFVSFAFGLLVGAFVFLIMGSMIAFIVSFLVFTLFPYLGISKLIANRQEEFNFGLKGIIDKVTSMMKSGVGFEQAFKKSILTTKSKFTRDVLSIYMNEKDIIGEERSFEKMFTLVESKELRIFYLVIKIGRESGGKFSNTLETLRQTLHAQGTIKQEITSSTKEIKVGTYMIMGITVGLYMMMNGVFEGALDEHFFGTDEGKLQMFFIIVWVSFGLFINNMMTKIKD
ncbi:MAG: type II secretion system F family protein [Campylobacterota bacterium]|nr:type II secretion system F family protein [Campylobacterota bacterium]